MARSQIISFVITQCIIWVPLFIGHRIRKIGWMRESVARPLHRFNLIVIGPFIYGLGLWSLNRSSAGWVRVPVIMTILLAALTLLAVWMARRLTKDRRREGALAIMIPLSNVGHTMAGFLTILLISQAAYPYNALLMAPQLFFIFLVWMPLARHYSHSHGQPFWTSIWQSLLSLESLSLVGLVAGAALNAAGVPMGPLWHTLLSWLVFLGTVLVMFALGTRMHVRRIGPLDRHLCWVYPTKFLLPPLLMLALLMIFGVRGEPAGALFIASCMPNGVLTVALATMFDLDVDLANAGYLWTTACFLLIVLPLMILALQAPIFR